MPYSSTARCLVLEIESMFTPLEVRCSYHAQHAVDYPPLSQLDAYRLPCFAETEITKLDSIGGWVYRVEIHGNTYVLKDIGSMSVLGDFMTELEALIALQELPNVAKLYGLVTCSDKRVVKGVLVEYLQPLHRFIEHGFRLEYIFRAQSQADRAYVDPTTRTLDLMQEIVEIISNVHEANFVITGVIAERFGLTKDGHVKLMDLGKQYSLHPDEQELDWHSFERNVHQMGELLIVLLDGTNGKEEILGLSIEDSLRFLMYGRQLDWIVLIAAWCRGIPDYDFPSARQVFDSFRAERTSWTPGNGEGLEAGTGLQLCVSKLRQGLSSYWTDLEGIKAGGCGELW